jgi:hypothetical protein
MVGGWRKLYNEELHKLHFSPNIIRMINSRRMKWTEHVEHVRKKRNADRILVGRPEGNRPLERPRRMWENNIKIDLIGIRLDSMDWIDLAQDMDQ